MKLKSLVLAVSAVALFSGCTPYQERLALGAVAGAATGALVVDSQYGYYNGGYYNGGYGCPRVYPEPYIGYYRRPCGVPYTGYYR